MFVVRMSTILNPAWRHVKVTPVCSRVSTRVSCFRRLFERLSSSPPPRCNRAHHVWRTYLAWTRTFEWISAFTTEWCKHYFFNKGWLHSPASVQTLRKSAPLKSSESFTTASQSEHREQTLFEMQHDDSLTGDTTFVRWAFIAHRFRRASRLDLREFWEFLSEPVRLAKEFLQEQSITCQCSQRLA